MRKEKGVTLIALIVTIIIMIIIAAVAIASLTGENGIISTAQEAQVYNAYASAREQMNLSFMTVRSRIEFEVAKNSTYDAREEASEEELFKLVAQDYLDSEEFTFYLDNEASVIYILYTNTNIKSGLVDDTTDPVQPYNNNYVMGYITLSAQSCTLTFDAIEVTMNSGNSSLSDNDSFTAANDCYNNTTTNSAIGNVGDFWTASAVNSTAWN